MFQTALRWMGGRWWAAAAIAAVTIVLFRMTEVGAPSSITPHGPGHSMVGRGMVGSGAIEASFRKDPAAASPMDSDLEFLALRAELAELESALRLERERAALYSKSYEDVSRQYGEISRLASELMQVRKGERGAAPRALPQSSAVSTQPASFRRPRAGVPMPAQTIILGASEPGSEPVSEPASEPARGSDQ